MVGGGGGGPVRDMIENKGSKRSKSKFMEDFEG